MKNPIDRFMKLDCGGCNRTISVRDYNSGWPPKEDADQSKVHWLYDPNAPFLGVYCTCGHWTGWTTKRDEKTFRALPAWPL